MNARKKLIVANWKLHPESLDDAKKIFTKTREVALSCRRVTTVICPPALYLEPLRRLLPLNKDLALGAQDAFFENSGSYTGEISPQMIRRAGARYVILGHSERRALGDTNELVGKKVGAAVREGLSPILCVGEQTRDHHGDYLAFLSAQLSFGLSQISGKELSGVIIAYEPVWAIGRRDSEAPAPRDIFEMVIFIRKFLTERYGKDQALSMTILYGGSVSEHNTGSILTDGGVSGLLIGRESLVMVDFAKILGLANIS